MIQTIVVLLFLIVMSAIYFQHAYSELSEDYYNTTSELNKTIETFMMEQKFIEEKLKELNTSKERESTLGEKYTTLKTEKENLEKELAKTQEELGRVNTQLANTKKELDTTKRELESTKSERDSYKSQLEAANKKIEGLEKDLIDLLSECGSSGNTTS
ncbi:MAG: hypothetical protein ACE5J9_06200 [Methanosarcinales archaeon]